jgi:hypothetical protein
MVDKAQISTLNSGRQAGERQAPINAFVGGLEVSDEVSHYYPNAGVPEGVTFADLEPAERAIIEWEEGSDTRAAVTAFRVYELVAAALRAKQLLGP